MANFRTAYSLCSLIDQKSFIHISQEQEDCAILALGRNIVLRYRLSDQKQLNSWSTIQKLSSNVIYDRTKDRYLGVFENNALKIWTSSDESLAKIKKTRLREQVYELLLLNDEPVVLFQNGACCKVSLTETEDYSPPSGFLPDGVEIIQAKIIERHSVPALFILAAADKKTICYSASLEPDTYAPLRDTVTEFSVKRTGHKLVASCFITQDSVEMLISLWSDGFLFGRRLLESGDETDQYLGALRAVCTKRNVALLPLSHNHIAVYGGSPVEEGAVLAIYNIDFAMIQASMSFKFLQTPVRLWAAHGRIILGVGMRLVCVPYGLETGRVVSIVGSRTPAVDLTSSDVVPVVPTVDWEDSKPQPISKDPPKAIRDLMESLSTQGFSEAGISEAVIASLIEKKDVHGLCWCIENFVDIPEKLVLKLLNLALTVPMSVISNGCSHDNEEDNSPIHPPQRAALVNKIFGISLNSASLATSLRINLSFENCLLLLNFLSHQYASQKCETGKNIFHWMVALVDAFYQQFILLKDETSMDALVTLKENICEEVAVVNELHELMPLILRLRQGKSLVSKSVKSTSYSIQRIKLYK